MIIRGISIIFKLKRKTVSTSPYLSIASTANELLRKAVRHNRDTKKVSHPTSFNGQFFLEKARKSTMDTSPDRRRLATEMLYQNVPLTVSNTLDERRNRMKNRFKVIPTRIKKNKKRENSYE